MKYLAVLFSCYMLFVGSVIAQKEWKVAEIGGADSVQGPYKLEKKVEFFWSWESDIGVKLGGSGVEFYVEFKKIRDFRSYFDISNENKEKRLPKK